MTNKIRDLTDREADLPNALSSMDKMIHTAISRFTLGVSPAALMMAYLDWLVHLSISPAKQLELVQKAVRKAVRFYVYALRCASDPGMQPCIEPLPQDKRFGGEEWRRMPFNLMYQSFLLTQQWFHNATTGVPESTDTMRTSSPSSPGRYSIYLPPLTLYRRIPKYSGKRWSQGAIIYSRGG
jgi:hypothetical protein